MYELDYVKMGARIRQLRKAKGWSQAKLADKCGISLNFMGNIERGTRRMSMDTFASLCSELETDADVLLWGISKHAETPVYTMWGQAGKSNREEGEDRKKNNNKSVDKEEETYAIYVQIMKSVADILQRGGGCAQEPRKHKRDKGKKS